MRYPKLGPLKLSGQSRIVVPQVVASGHRSEDFEVCSRDGEKSVFPLYFSIGEVKRLSLGLLNLER